MRQIIIHIIISFFGVVAYAQDVHWSQFDYNPIFQNPANTGRFDGGNQRFHANFRDQWRSVTVPFQTINFTYDYKHIWKNLSFGGHFFHDVAGDGQFRTIEIMPAVSWNQLFGNQNNQRIFLGGQVGINYRQFDPSNFTFGDQWNGSSFSPSQVTNEVFFSDQKLNLNASMGTVYSILFDERKNIAGGLAVHNLVRPNQGFFLVDVPREMRTNIFVQGQYPINLDWDLQPSLQVNFQGAYREFIIGSQARYVLKDRMGDYLAVKMGTYFRFMDAFYLMGGLEWQNWWAGISYDVNVSKLAVASRGRGGFEFSLRYIIKSIKANKKLYRVCPDFI